MANIEFGKYIIEHLTTAMYEDSKIVYREYIQNSADQIDKARKQNYFSDEELFVDITIDPEKRYVKIFDNATGIKSGDVQRILGNVADSDKIKGVDKGFRGIGRLGGLGYCNTLKFTTSFKGETVKTIMVWDAKKCRDLIDDSENGNSALEILSEIISYEKSEASTDDHFFTVEMIDIREENRELLDVDKISDYIGWVAPVPYDNSFLFSSKIMAFSKRENLKIDTYRIGVNGEDIVRKYNTNIYDKNNRKYEEIRDIGTKEFYNKDKELLAWMWYGISAFDRQIPKNNSMRCIRLRKENIQIGDCYALNKHFKEVRGNPYYIGEVHACHKDLIPNARRDYFVENEASVQLDAELQCFFTKELHNLYYRANQLKNAYKHIEQCNEQKEDFTKKQFIDDIHKKQFYDELSKKEKKAENAIKVIEKIRQIDESSTKKIFDIYSKKNKHEPISSGNVEEDSSNKDGFITSELSHLDKKQRKLIATVYRIIKDNLPPDQSTELIHKIQEGLIGKKK